VSYEAVHTLKSDVGVHQILPKMEPIDHMSTNQRGVVCGTKENSRDLVPQGNKDLQKKFQINSVVN
jgi:hypothetical protein